VADAGRSGDHRSSADVRGPFAEHVVGRAGAHPPLTTALRPSKLSEHFLSFNQPARLDIFLRGNQSPFKDEAISGIEPVARIERQKGDLGSFGKPSRLVHDKSSIVNTAFEGHEEIILS